MTDKLGEQIDSYDYGPRRISPGERIERLERAVLLLTKHVGATGWDKPLQDVLDEIESNLLRQTASGKRRIARDLP